MRPITKNIIVVDEFGKEYTSTYAKRANGLVKNGRARWLDGNTICLVCPPDTLNLEDNDMSNKADNMETINAVCEKEEFRNEHGISKDDFVVIYAGKLDESKGGMLLANAIKERLCNND